MTGTTPKADPTDPHRPGKVNEMLVEQTNAMAKEISDLKSMIANPANQMRSSMAAPSTVIIGKVDSIHRTFTKETQVAAKPGQNNNNTSHNNNNNGNKEKENNPPAGTIYQGVVSAPPPPTSGTSTPTMDNGGQVRTPGQED